MPTPGRPGSSSTRPATASCLEPLPEGSGFRAALAGAVEKLAGLRVAYSPSLGGQVSVEPAVAAAVRQAVARLADAGAYVEETDPDFTDPVQAFHALWFSGAARVIQPLGREKRELLDPGLRGICEEGSRLTALDYLAAVDTRMELGRRMGHFLERYDLLVTPTLPITAFEASAEVPKGSGHTRWTGWTPFTYPFDLTQQPAATVPVGADADGLPIGLQPGQTGYSRTRVRGATVVSTDGDRERWDHGVVDGRGGTSACVPLDRDPKHRRFA